MFNKFFTFSRSAFIALIFMGTASICLAQGNTWTTKADMQIPSMQHGTCVVNGKIYSIGGYNSVDVCRIPATQKVEEYDPSTDTWTIKEDMPTARHGLSISAVDGKIYVIGGHPVLCEGELSTVEVYDPLTDTWDTTKTLCQLQEEVYQPLLSMEKFMQLVDIIIPPI
jgi:N-acetylneuraminic acid mutarotase